MDKYLRSTDIIDWEHPEILEIARSLCADVPAAEEKIKRCYHWVRDEIKHSFDFNGASLKNISTKNKQEIRCRYGEALPSFCR